jgi:hypothetical protein
MRLATLKFDLVSERTGAEVPEVMGATRALLSPDQRLKPFISPVGAGFRRSLPSETDRQNCRAMPAGPLFTNPSAGRLAISCIRGSISASKGFADQLAKPHVHPRCSSLPPAYEQIVSTEKIARRTADLRRSHGLALGQVVDGLHWYFRRRSS